MNEAKMNELCQAEDMAYFRADLCVYSPESYTLEEKKEICNDMMSTSKEVLDAMREDFDMKCNSLHFCSKLANIIVLVYLALASVMAFVVLLNLDVMFISEKRRELIVLIICGYTTKKAKGYIWHDSAALTVIGIICGVALGVVTRGLSVVSVETSDIMCMRGVS